MDARVYLWGNFLIGLAIGAMLATWLHAALCECVNG